MVLVLPYGFHVQVVGLAIVAQVLLNNAVVEVTIREMTWRLR